MQRIAAQMAGISGGVMAVFSSAGLEGRETGPPDKRSILSSEWLESSCWV